MKKWIRANCEIIFIILAVLTAVILRYAAALDNLRFDEVLSLEGARGLSSWWRVFFVAHDNNHILNSIYLRYFGEGSWWASYRFFSIITGSAAIGLIGLIGFRRNLTTGIIALILSTFSFPLIIFSSEARGYAPAVFFSLLAFIAFQNYGQKSKKKTLIIFWLSIIAGFLSHLLFAYIFAGFFFSVLFPLLSRPVKLGRRWIEFAKWYFAPSIFIVFFLMFFVKNLVLAGGLPAPQAIERFSLFIIPALGLPYGFTASILVAFVVFFAVLFWLYCIERQGNRNWIFFSIVVALVPTLTLFLPLPFFNPNYLIFSLPFFYLLLASMLSNFILQKKWQFLFAILIIVLFCFFSINEIKRHFKLGRGNYIEALQYIVQETKDPIISITSDHDFRNEKMLNFYRQFVKLKSGQKIEYVRSLDNTQHPSWLIVHDPNPGAKPFNAFIRLGSDTYHLKRSFLNGSVISGWSWFIYRRE